MTAQNEREENLIDLPLSDAGIDKNRPPAHGPDAPSGDFPLESRRRGPLILAVSGIFPIILAFLIGGVAGLYFQPPGLQQFFRLTGLEPGGGTDTPIAQAIDTVMAQEEVAVVSAGDVVALGRVIPRDDVVTLALPFGSGDARIEDLRVVTGDTVASGEIVAVLDNRAALESAVEAAEAAIAVQRAALLQARATVAASRDEALASLQRSEATERAAQATLVRTKDLFERGTTTRSALDEAEARAEEAVRDVERSRVTLSRYAGPEEDQPDILLAEANLVAAEAELVRAERDLDKAFVRAPIAGTVLDVNVRAGERPDEAGIIDLGNTEVMTVEAEVYQSLIGRVALGDPVTVIAEAFDTELTGKVSAIGLEIGRQTITSDDPAANTDARVVDVIVTLDEASTPPARRYTNLEVVVRIDAGRQE